MAPNPRVVAAYRAMTTLGINEVKVKPVLKQLLKLYDKNWEMIEQENYRVLADAIFEQDEKEVNSSLYLLNLMLFCFLVFFKFSNMPYNLV